MKKRGGPIRIPHFCETFFIVKPSAPPTPPLSSRFGAGGVTRPRPPEDVSSYANSLKLPRSQVLSVTFTRVFQVFL